MNIALISVAPPYRGGISEHTKGLYNTLIQNHSVKIFSFYHQYPKLFFPGKSQVIDKEYNFSDTDYCISSINPFSWVKTTQKILDFKPDLVIFTYWSPYFAPCFGFIAKRLKIKIGSNKLMSIFHNVLPHEKSFFNKFLFNYYIKSFEKCIFMSAFVKDQLNVFKQSFDSSVRFLPIDTNYKPKFERSDLRNEIKINADDNIILFFGLIRKYKGLEVLLRAAYKHFKINPNSKLIIAGEAYENKTKYSKIIEELNIKNKVIWFDQFISNEKIEKLMILSDLLVLPYHSASQSGVLSQAWQYEIPSIATNVGGLPEYIDNQKSGYIVNENDSNDLAKKITYFFEANCLLNMKEYIRLNKNKFSWENYIEGIWELIDES